MEIRKDASRPFLSPHCGDDDDDCIYILFFPLSILMCVRMSALDGPAAVGNGALYST